MGTPVYLNDILTDGRNAWRIIDVQDDYIVALLECTADGPVDREEDNIGEFILLNDIAGA